MPRSLLVHSSFQSELRRARLAVAIIFFLDGALVANWVARIPAVQQQVRASTGELGLTLLGTAFGALLAMPLTGLLISRWGSRPVTTLSALIFCATLPLLSIAQSTWGLFGALVAFGASNGALDVSMNAQAIVVERGYARPIMASFHALFSLGGMAGAAMGGWAAGQQTGTKPHFLFAALLGIGVAALATRRFLAGDHEESGASLAVPTRAVMALGVVAICVMLNEGAMADWSAIYLTQFPGTGPGLAATGYAVFSLAMAIGRMVGDRLTARFGAVRMVRWGSLLAATGMTAALFLQRTEAALAGFAFAGFGFASTVPIVFSAAGRTPGVPSGVGLAAVTTMGYFGFLAGPPVIGFAAEILTLRGALGLVAVSSVLMAVLAGSVRR